jgi:hypothetical protein
MRVQTKGERKGGNAQWSNRKYELVEEEAARIATLINLKNPECRRTRIAGAQEYLDRCGAGKWSAIRSEKVTGPNVDLEEVEV